MSEPMIIIEPCAGLGNRLLGLGSAYAVAEKLNRRLVVMWKREVGCNIRFSELFDLPFEVVEISENGFKNEPVAQLLGNHAKKKWRKMADRFLECDDVEQVKETEGYEGLFHLIEQTPVIYLKAFGPICEVGAESYSFLKPSKNIEEKGDYLFHELTGNCVGVHVRRTDHTDAIANSPLALFAGRMKKELEFAYQWVPEQVDRGHTTKSACGVLLMKVYMSLGEFDNAIKVGNEIVAKHPLMVNRFTSTKNNHPNLMFDLHSVEAKSDPANTEGILYGVSEPNNASGTGSAKTEIMANCVPMWNNNVVKTPSGKTGFAVTPDSKDVAAGIVEDVNKTYGRGIARVRPTNYFQYTIWTEKEKNDLRGRYNHDSWRRMEDLIYNDPTLKKANDPWYGKKAVKPVNMSCGDSIRCWFSWPHYKVYIPDPTAGSGQWKGGSSPIYLMRSAEVYLMLAECYYWKDNLGEAANMLNVVRKRAGADLLTAQDINIGEILNERARELYYEEHRHITLVRIAYTYALTGKPCEIFDGRIYKMENLCGPKGASNLKDAGYNFWFDWISQHNNFYNKGVKNRFAEYTMSVHHMLWPIPNKDIRANTNGHINQNNGYLGCENNVTPLQVPEEGQFMKD